MNARDRILSKLRAAAPSTVPAAPLVGDWFASHRPAEDAAAKVQRFRHFIELAHAEVHSVNRGNWVQKLWEVLAAKELRRLLLAPETEHGARAFEALTELGVECTAYHQPIEQGKAVMFRHIPASLTGARAAIAETGTLILWPDVHEPRLMSLVPPVHIVLLDANKIYNTFFEAISSEGWGNTQTHALPTNALLVSGPSKTADIQQTLAYGAHGPKELVVLLLEESAQ
ncbi:MAG: lactate utilization protein [Azonexus sp.]|nr:lactate utilization protein [Azonexus sp.]MCK6412130.1 lactate utilization protein [Azonexus sp.]